MGRRWLNNGSFSVTESLNSPPDSVNCMHEKYYACGLPHNSIYLMTKTGVIEVFGMFCNQLFFDRKASNFY